MKKLKIFSAILTLAILLAFSATAFAKSAIIGFTALTGGGTGALDAVECEDILGDNTNRAIATGDIAIGVTSGKDFYIYRSNASGTSSESSPDIIVPDDRTADCAGNGQWELISSINVARSATPQTVYRDSDCTDKDDNVYWTVNCTNTGSGTENCDISLYQQIAGAATEVLKADADGNMEIYAHDLNIASGKVYKINGTDYKDVSVTFTNKTIDAEATGNIITIPVKIWLAAAGCNNATASSLWDLPTANAAAPACITGTNTQKGVLDFDAATAESAQTHLMLPSDFSASGNLDVVIKWVAAATTGSVVWAVQTICVADAETDDPSWNTASTVTDAAKGTTLQTNDATITNVTKTGCAAGELMHLKIYRDAANGSDDMTGDARLIGIEVTYRRAM